MNTLLIIIIFVIVISQTSCLQLLNLRLWPDKNRVQCPVPRTTSRKPQTTSPKPQTTTTTMPKPTKCPYTLSDLEEVVDYFYIDKAATSVKKDEVLMIQRELIRNVTCTKPCPTHCPLPPPDVEAVAQFGRYSDGNERAVKIMFTEGEKDFILLDLEDSECACEIKRRIVQAVKDYGYGIISCNSISVAELKKALSNVRPSVCVEKRYVEYFTKYAINDIYFAAESELRKCKTKYIEAFNAAIAFINAEIEKCITHVICTEF